MARTSIDPSLLATIPSSKLSGTTTNDNAATGKVGEYIESHVGATAAPANNTWGDLTSVSLTAGDWDVTVSTLWEGSVTFTELWTGTSTTSGNSSAGMQQPDNYNGYQVPSSAMPLQWNQSIPRFRFSLSATTTVYLKYGARYTAGSPTTRGFISARRVR